MSRLYESVANTKKYRGLMFVHEDDEFGVESSFRERKRARERALLFGEQPDYNVQGETPRVTRALQFRTMGGQLSEKIFVVSSNVVSMSYNASRQQLTVEFQRWVKGVGRVIGGGARYLYFDISLEEWKSAKLAGSKGKWVWAVLRRGGKAYTRVR